MIIVIITTIRMVNYTQGSPIGGGGTTSYPLEMVRKIS